jgi:hypothetical protein
MRHLRQPISLILTTLVLAGSVPGVAATAQDASESRQVCDRLARAEPVTITGTTKGSASIRWNVSTLSGVGYVVERRELGSDWRRIAVALPGAVESGPAREARFRFVDAELAADTYYCYRIIVFTEEAFAISPEACTQTDAGPEPVEMQKLPDFLRLDRMSLHPDFVAGGDTAPCLHPEVEAAIQQAQELLAELGGNLSHTKYTCHASSWGLDDFKEFLGGLKDFFENVLDHGVDIVKCTGRGLLVVGACPGLVGWALLSCISDIAGAGECPIEVCKKDEFGFEVCTTEQGPCWLGSCLLLIPTTALCVEAAKSFDKHCLGGGD